MSRMSSNGDATSNSGDHLDQLLRGFQSRNEFRSDPNYVLEPVDLDAAVPDRFVNLLRSSSLLRSEEIKIVDEVEETPAEVETNSGLILLAENYDKNSRKKQARGRIFSALAGVVLFVSVISFAALAGYVLAGIVSSVIAAVLMVLGRSSAKQAEEIQQIADALVQPEETS